MVPSRKGDGHFYELKRKRTKYHTVKRLILTVYEQSIIGRAWGSVYTEFVLHLFVLKALDLFILSLDLI